MRDAKEEGLMCDDSLAHTNLYVQRRQDTFIQHEFHRFSGRQRRRRPVQRHFTRHSNYCGCHFFAGQSACPVATPVIQITTGGVGVSHERH